MFVLGKYRVIEQLYRSAYTVIYRAVLESVAPTSDTVILKLLNEEFPSPESMARFRREYEFAKRVASESTVKAYDLFRYQNTLVMVQEDFESDMILNMGQLLSIPLILWGLYLLFINNTNSISKLSCTGFTSHQGSYILLVNTSHGKQFP